MFEPGFLFNALLFLSAFFIFVLGVLVLTGIIFFILDISQRKNAIRHNYPVIGRLRRIFEHFGVFFRQYFFAMDREEMPFNRAQRNWVYNASQKMDNTVPFGSTRDLRPTGTILFANCPFPTLEKDAVDSPPMIIGPSCTHPFEAKSFFNISGMSFGALSKPAVQALSHGAHGAGCWLNTGEGGLSEWHLEGHPDIVFQMGTAKYGVRNKDGGLDEKKLVDLAARPEVKMIEIKLSQGAKPGKGGILPAAKVSEEIARIRGIPQNKASISPNRHPEIANIAELLDFISRIRTITGKPTGFKCVVGAYGWIDEFLDEICRRGPEHAPDFITVDSADGGTGAAPMSLIDNVGLPIQESLPLMIDQLCAHGLRDRVKVIASGKLVTPTEVAWALCMGADFVVSARGFMFALGCIQALRCHRDTCPTGVTTHNPRLQAGLDPKKKSVRVANYVESMVHEVGVIAHSCGVREPRRLKRHHARMVTTDGKSVLLSDLYPEPSPNRSKLSEIQ